MRFKRANTEANLTKKHFIHAYSFLFACIILVLMIFISTKRDLFLIVDGDEIVYDTTALTVEQALDEYDGTIDLTNADIEFDENNLVFSTPTVNIATLKDITVSTMDNSTTISTYATSLEELEQEEDFKALNLDENYQLQDPNIAFDDNIELYFEYHETKTETEEEIVDQEVVTTEDADMYEGNESIVVEGQPEITEITYEVEYVDGKEVSRTEISNEVTQEAINQEVAVGTKEAETVDPDDYTVWDELAACESGGNWQINTGNGYYGGLQINPTSWAAIAPGLGISASLPSEASREEQIAVGQVMQESGGWSVWPACSSKLGL